MNRKNIIRAYKYKLHIHMHFKILISKLIFFVRAMSRIIVLIDDIIILCMNMMVESFLLIYISFETNNM